MSNMLEASKRKMGGTCMILQSVFMMWKPIIVTVIYCEQRCISKIKAKKNVVNLLLNI